MPTYIRGEKVANATRYDLLRKNTDGTYEILVNDASAINFEVSALGLAAGDHELVVIAQADGYEDSEYSESVTYTVTDSGDVTTLDDIAYGGLTYRDIFITNNLAPRINNNSMGGYAVATGTVTLESNTTSANNYVPPYSLKCFGSSTCQIKSNKEYAYNANTKYYMASNIKVNRYTSGRVGVFPSGAVYDATISEKTNGWVTKGAIITLNSNKDPYDLRMGTAQADMDAYINNPVIIDMGIFDTAPDEATLNTLYSQYNNILIAGNQ